ncbi:MAG: DNA-protecting protein DprA [Magnetococcales bacterium]|nr:DNA-protecting protein DprA [Magnetococcales bacterium]
MDRKTLLDWLKLTQVPGLGPVGIGRLLDHFGQPEAVLEANEQGLSQVPGIRPALVAALNHFRQATPPEPINHHLDRLHHLGGTVLIRGGKHYPPLLATIHDPPPVLFVLGDPVHLQGEQAIAVVGSRRASRQAVQFAQTLAQDLAQNQITTVSGLALGIDSAAHRGALSGKGPTIAVIATGLDVDYPPGNRGLKEEILAQGCLITEAPLGTQPAPYLFPPRNRIISGLSQGVVVVEAAPRSGSLITARLALEQGREVFAVPGSGAYGDSRAKGVNNLLRQGAVLVEGVADILQELSWSLPTQRISSPHPEREEQQPHQEKLSEKKNMSHENITIIKQLEDGPLLADELARKCQLTVASLSRILLQLELTGVVERLPGNQYALLRGAGSPLK